MDYFKLFTETVAEWSTCMVDSVFKMFLTLLLIRSFIKSRTAASDRPTLMADY